MITGRDRQIVRDHGMIVMMMVGLSISVAADLLGF